MLNPPPEPMDIGEEKYSVGWYLFPNNHGGAKEWMAKMQANPDVYFPFKMELADCSDGDCSKPLAEGNVLHLSGQYEIGSVDVIQVTSTSFTFLALSDHQLAAGGMIQFEIYEKPAGEEAEVYLSIRASNSTGGIEAYLPGSMTKPMAKVTWSSMVAALVCEWAYIGREQYRRC